MTLPTEEMIAAIQRHSDVSKDQFNKLPIEIRKSIISKREGIRINISDDFGNRLSFTASKMQKWNKEELAEILKEIADVIKAPTKEDKDLF